jgi:SAM-dependent methyltransferase
MSDPRAKYERFRPVLQAPLDNHPEGAFPIVAGDRHFDLGQYQAESAGANVGMFDHLIQQHPDELFLDLGCGHRAKTYDNCLYLEVYRSKSADLIVEPTGLYPIRDQSLMGIGCFAVLEHVPKPWLVIQEMHRMLKPGGHVMIDWPFLQPVHGYPSHYFNATREGLTSIFQEEGFEVTQAFTGAHQNAAFTVRWILHVLLQRLPEAERRRVGKMRVRDLAALDPLGSDWTRLVEALPLAAQSELACGNMLVGRKPGWPRGSLRSDALSRAPSASVPDANVVTHSPTGDFLSHVRRG